MRVLFVVIPERGHLRAPVAVAQRLERDGHDTAFFAHGNVADVLREAGIRGKLFTPPSVPATAPRRPQRLHDVAWLAKHWELGTRAVLRAGMLEAVSAAVEAFAPDVMAIDPIAYHGIAVAEARAVRWAGISTNLVPLAPPDVTCTMFQAYARFEGARAELFREHGIVHPVKVNEVRSPWLNVVFTTEELVPLGDEDARIQRVGPALPLPSSVPDLAFPWARLATDRPAIYVSFGGGDALAFPPDTFPRIFAARRADEAQLVAVLHHLLDEPSLRDLPAHVLPVRFAPQIALLPKMAAVITHGGANTVMESLAAGRPMLVVPIGYDQPLQAHFVERAGAGIHIPLAELTTDRCRDALDALLSPGSTYRRRAEEIAASYAAHDGAELAASLLTS